MVIWTLGIDRRVDSARSSEPPANGNRIERAALVAAFSN